MLYVLFVLSLNSLSVHCSGLIYYSIHHFNVFFVNSLQLSFLSDIIQWLWRNFLSAWRIDSIMSNSWPFPFADVKQLVEQDLVWFSDLDNLLYHHTDLPFSSNSWLLSLLLSIQTFNCSASSSTNYSAFIFLACWSFILWIS